MRKISKIAAVILVAAILSAAILVGLHISNWSISSQNSAQNLNPKALFVSIAPTSATVTIGQRQLFNSSVSGGTSPYSYQWYLNGSAVSGATNSSWTFAPTSVGAYTVYVNITDEVGVRAESNVASASASAIQIVAAENFWGSLVSQLGGARVQVLSIVTDPNADPHEYESNAADARAIANAEYVIVNGAGYDDWALLLISADNNPNQTVLNVANLLGKKEGDNPHFWYYPLYVNETVHQMYLDLVSIDPAGAAYYKQQYVNLNASLAVYNERIDEIRQQFAGTEVASTESIFVYLANATGLDLVSPPAFMEAVAEGNDPPIQSVVQFQQQLESGNVSVLVYNEQTVTPLTQSMKALAAQNNVTVVGVTETIQPPDVSFQEWMNAELITLQDGLSWKTLGQ